MNFTMNLYFLRHGETEQNKKKVFYGSLDVGLTEKGRLQAKKASKFFDAINFDKVYTSDRKRTKETAELVLEDQEFTMIHDARINEIDFGEFEGKNYEEIQKRYPKQCEEWKNNWKDFVPPNGESYGQFYKRVQAFFDELLAQNDENVLVVTHGGVIRSLYCFVLGGNLDFYWKFSSRNCDLSIIKYEYGNLFIDSITHTNM